MNPITLLAVAFLLFLLTRTPIWAKFKTQLLLIGGGVLVFWLVATGKLHALFAVVAAAIPMAQRIWSVVRFWPAVRQMADKLTGNTSASAGNHSGVPDGPMTRAKAAQILGVPEDADAKTVRDAHRRLIGKLHPDKGGNDYMAGLLNQARDTLNG